MAEEFEGRDLSDSVFWGVDLRRSMFRDVDISNTTFFHTTISNASIDGVIDGLVVNGVDVTSFVNERDRWYPLRTQLSPGTEEGMRTAWAGLQVEWGKLYELVANSSAQLLNKSVNGEWSLRDTLRHLVFVMDKWFAWPILEARTFVPMGLPNKGSMGFEWPGLDRDADSDFAAVLVARRIKCEVFGEYLAGLRLAGLAPEVEVLENGTMPTLMCFHAVLEEEFEHLRYALRDFSVLLGVSTL